MRLSGPCAELFAAFSRVNRAALRKNALVSCPVLSRAPNYGNILARFVARGGDAQVRGPLFFARSALHYLAANLGHLAFLALVRLCVWGAGWRSPLAEKDPSGGRLVIIDTFAVLPRLLEKGQFTEGYLPGLAEAARKAGNEVVHFYRLYGSRNPRHLFKALSILQKNGPGLTEAHLLRSADWLGLLWHVARYPFALLALVRSLADEPAGSPGHAIREALVETCGQCVVSGEAVRLAARRLGMALPQQQGETPCPLILSWFENQTINRCFYRGLWQAREEGAPPFRTIGAQLLVWPEALLNNHIDPAEQDLLPDKILVNGPCFLPEKLPETPQMSVGPALRYRALFEAKALVNRPAAQGPDRAEKPKREAECTQEAGAGQKPLLVLLSYHPDETRRVLSLVRPLAVANPLAVQYKFHPATQVGDFVALLPKNPALATGSLYAALAGVGAVIGAGSGALVEAAALGVPTLACLPASGARAGSDAGQGMPELSLNYLPEFGKGVLWDEVALAADIPQCLLRLRRMAERDDFRQTAAEFRSLLFAEPEEALVVSSFELAPGASPPDL